MRSGPPVHSGAWWEWSEITASKRPHVPPSPSTPFPLRFPSLLSYKKNSKGSKHFLKFLNSNFKHRLLLLLYTFLQLGVHFLVTILAFICWFFKSLIFHVLKIHLYFGQCKADHWQYAPKGFVRVQNTNFLRIFCLTWWIFKNREFW